MCGFERLVFGLQFRQLRLNPPKLRASPLFCGPLNAVDDPAPVKMERFIDQFGPHPRVLLLKRFENDAENVVAEILAFLARISQ